MHRSTLPQENLSNPAIYMEEPPEGEVGAIQRIIGPRLLPHEWLPPVFYMVGHRDPMRIGDDLLTAHGYPKDKIPNIPTDAYGDVVRISDDDDRDPGAWEI
ncbi:hypothetical protein CSAL01_00272 [Colletotrichum salicis]|uniref:Uncharacterized protein n=1 Tax=Colletotrichum salicis TaxID=1209931 RepID=A0A135V6P9_9PEZI|nr:hypothetical protein CSAL01_00272 [Colletotrichum salicis]